MNKIDREREVIPRARLFEYRINSAPGKYDARLDSCLLLGKLPAIFFEAYGRAGASPFINLTSAFLNS